jgi:hypothetical protein
MPRLIGKVDPHLGPLIQARVSPSQAYVRSLGPLPANVTWPHTVWLLIDTGASHTMIDEKIINVFNLPHPTNVVPVTGAMQGGEEEQLPQYALTLELLCHQTGAVYALGTLDVTAGAAKGFDHRFNGLLGRDVLTRGSLSWSGNVVSLDLP